MRNGEGTFGNRHISRMDGLQMNSLHVTSGKTTLELIRH